MCIQNLGVGTSVMWFANVVLTNLQIYAQICECVDKYLKANIVINFCKCKVFSS